MPKVVVKDMVLQPTITDLDHVTEVIDGGELDTTLNINNVVSGKHFVDNFDEYFPMPDSNYYIWVFPNSIDCERILKSMSKDDKITYFYENNPKDRKNLLLGIQTKENKWRIIRNENTNTKQYDYCIYDYFKNKQYLLVDPVEVNMNGTEKEWESYISLYVMISIKLDEYNKKL